MSDMRTILWHGPHDDSTEFCELTPTDEGWSLTGIVLLPANDQPSRCEYEVHVNRAWVVRSVEILQTVGSSRRHLHLTTDGSIWSVDGRHDPALDGCTDVDLRVTPATNTIPIRRRGIGIGSQFTTRAAWVGYPDLAVVPSEQHYQRLSQTAFRYSSGAFTADLDVDGDGLVRRYGEEYWRSIAHD